MGNAPSGLTVGNRLWGILARGMEPAPAGFIARQAYYPWLVISITCVSAFIGQLDASMVQLARQPWSGNSMHHWAR